MTTLSIASRARAKKQALLTAVSLLALSLGVAHAADVIPPSTLMGQGVQGETKDTEHNPVEFINPSDVAKPGTLESNQIKTNQLKTNQLKTNQLKSNQLKLNPQPLPP